MRYLLPLAGLCLSASLVAQDQRIDQIIGFAVTDPAPPPQHERPPEEEIRVMGPKMVTVRAQLARRPTSRWADADVLDRVQEEIGGCERVRMGLFVAASGGSTSVLEWRFSRFDAMALLSEAGVSDAVSEPRWGPREQALLDPARVVPFVLQRGSTLDLSYAPTEPDAHVRLVVYAAGPEQGLHEVYSTKPGGGTSFSTTNLGEGPLLLLVTAWWEDGAWQQTAIAATPADILVRGLKYYEFELEAPETPGRTLVRAVVHLHKDR